MGSNWQTWGALGVVALTALIMSYRLLFRKKTGCGSDCGCHDHGKHPIQK